MNSVTFTVYLLVSFVIAFLCTIVLVLMFTISDYIATKKERKKRKTVWELEEK